MADEGGQNGERRDYATGLRSGIFERKHRRAIGPALWTFAWCVDRQTDETGWVLGGKVLTYQEICDGSGLETAEEARHDVRRLVKGGYLIRETITGRGIRLRIAAPRKALRHHPGATGRGTPAAQAGVKPTPAAQADPPAAQAGVYIRSKTHRDSEEEKGTTPSPPSPTNGTRAWTLAERRADPAYQAWRDRTLELLRQAAKVESIDAVLEGWLSGGTGWLTSHDERAKFDRLQGRIRPAIIGAWAKAAATEIEERAGAGHAKRKTYAGTWALDLLVQMVTAHERELRCSDG